jgi:hypothetical protein
MAIIKNKKRKIVVVGDVCRDNVLAPISKKTYEEGKNTEWNWQKENNLGKFALPGEALLIKDMMNVLPDKNGNVEIVSYPEIALAKLSNRDIIYSLAEGEMVSSDTFYIKEFLGYSGSGPEDGVPTFARDFACNLSGEKDVIVIDDAGNGFRNVESAWKNVIESAEKNGNSVVIYNMSGPLFKGKLWETISQKKLLNRTILIIDADTLRAEGVNISRRLSWDRTIADFITVLAYKKHNELEKCPHILVRFGLEGVIYYYHSIEEKKEKIRKARMFYIPDRCEDEITDSTCPGTGDPIVRKRV